MPLFAALSPEIAEEGPFWMRSRLWLSFLTILANIAGVMGALAADQYLSDLTCYGPGAFSSLGAAMGMTPPFCVRLVGSPAETPGPADDAYWPKDWRSMLPAHARDADRPLTGVGGTLEAVDLTLPPLPPELSNQQPN
jgi:hypothetical protein